MATKQFTSREINKGLRYLEEGFARLSIMSEIIDPCFSEREHVYPHEVMWVLRELIFHAYGQITRLCFDKYKYSNYKTVSVSIIHEQISISRKSNKFSKKTKNVLTAIGNDMEKMYKKYGKKLEGFTDKHYAHKELRNSKQKKREVENLKVGWVDYKKLLNSSKEAVTGMSKCWDGRKPNFSEGHYNLFRDEFWGSIKPIGRIEKRTQIS